MDNILFLPPKISGKHVDLDYEYTAASAPVAEKIYALARKYLLQPALWHDLAGRGSAAFKPVSAGGERKRSLLTLNDYVSIDIPGPGSRLGEGLDWTQAKKIQDGVVPGAEESFGLTLVACANPGKREADSAHFFKIGASSSFVLQRSGNVLRISYHGRNEIPNLDTESVIDNIRNAVVATGAAAGLSELQWTVLIRGLLDEAAEKETGE